MAPGLFVDARFDFERTECDDCQDSLTEQRLSDWSAVEHETGSFNNKETQAKSCLHGHVWAI